MTAHSSQRQKHILVLAQRVPFPPNKGEKLRTYYQIRWLIDQGYRVTVAAPIAHSEDQEDLFKLSETLHINTLGAKLTHKIIRLLAGFLKGRSLSEANFYSPALERLVTDTVSTQQVDAVLLTASSLLCYSKALSCPVLVDFMDLDSEKWRQYSEKKHWLFKWVYQRESRAVAELEQRALNNCAAIFLISEAEVQQLKACYPKLPHEKVHILGNGIDTAAFYPAPPQEDPQPQTQAAYSDFVLLFVGVMDYNPNVEAMLWFSAQVWPSVKKHIPEATLVIAGMNPTASIKALEKEAGIEVTGFVDDILPYFHRASIFIAPFLMARGVQNKVLQAFACGLPTICTRVGIEGIDCIEAVHYLQADTAEDFLDAIRLLKEHPGKRHQLAQNAHDLIQDRYAWSARLNELGHTLETVISCETT